ncbi:gliding motility protein RemB [Pelobium sp.]|nr:gliding motility protein RemB [Pelobium sp.]MDA9555554.1 gliding motility protein RemB [Pelobium sp.]
MLKKLILICIVIIIQYKSSICQTKGYPNQVITYNYSFYQQFNPYLEKDSNLNLHSSIKPYFIDDSVFSNSSFVEQYFKEKDTSKTRSWAYRKLFTEHLIEYKNNDFSFYADYLPDLQIGYDKRKASSTWINTRGYQIGGTIGSKFSFYTSGYENQGQFPSYLNSYIDANDLIPGQTYDRSFGKPTKDWSYSTAILSYTPSKYFNFILAHDKNFIGDGYRSMLLSDVSVPHTFFKVTASLGRIKYLAIYSAMLEPKASRFSYDVGFRKKGGIFHYLDWNVNRNLTLGFFDAVIYAQADEQGNIRGFDWSYINPLIFLRPLEANSGSPDNALIGFTGKFNLRRNLSLYGQFALDEFESKNFFKKTGSSRNKWGAQLGLKGNNNFYNGNLSYFIEYNLARPYTYSSRTLILSYSNYSQPLAHPFGGNFKEVVSGITFKKNRLLISSRINLATYGLDVNNLNYGKDIFKPYTTAVSSTGNYIGNGLKTKFIYFDNALSILLNPKLNSRLELGYVYRKESNSNFNNQTSWINIGFRSSFRQFYYDF